MTKLKKFLLHDDEYSENSIDPSEAKLKAAKDLQARIKKNLEEEPDLEFGEEVASKEEINVNESVDIHPLSQKFYNILDEIAVLHRKKGQDYGSNEDPFLNVRSGNEFGISPWKNAISRGNDKMVRIKQYAKKGNLENESVRDSFLDLANYSIIALVLWEEENGK